MSQPLQLACFATFDLALAAIITTHELHVSILVTILVWYQVKGIEKVIARHV